MEKVEKIMEFTEYCINHIQEHIPNLLGSKCDSTDIARKLCAAMLADGTLTYSRGRAVEYIQEWWDECGDYFSYMEEYSENENPFKNPESFMVGMVHDAITSIINNAIESFEYHFDMVIETTEKITIDQDFIDKLFYAIEHDKPFTLF